jgi:hypothetical protein
MISLERLFSLAEVYEVAPERIVAAIAHGMGVTRDRDQKADSPSSILVVDPFVPGASGTR